MFSTITVGKQDGDLIYYFLIGNNGLRGNLKG